MIFSGLLGANMQSTKREDMLNTAHRIAEHTNVLIVCSSNHVSQMLHKEQCDHLRNVGVEFDLCMDKCISLKNGKRIFFRPFTGSPRHILGFDAFTMLDDFEAYRLDHDLQLSPWVTSIGFLQRRVEPRPLMLRRLVLQLNVEVLVALIVVRLLACFKETAIVCIGWIFHVFQHTILAC